MTRRTGVSRRDFLRLRQADQGGVLEVSCRELYMRAADGALAPEPASEYEPWMGEPPSVLRRCSVTDLLDRIERALLEVQVLRLAEPEWLSAVEGATRLEAAIAAFREHGGLVEIDPRS